MCVLPVSAGALDAGGGGDAAVADVVGAVHREGVRKYRSQKTVRLTIVVVVVVVVVQGCKFRI